MQRRGQVTSITDTERSGRFFDSNAWMELIKIRSHFSVRNVNFGCICFDLIRATRDLDMMVDEHPHGRSLLFFSCVGQVNRTLKIAIYTLLLCAAFWMFPNEFGSRKTHQIYSLTKYMIESMATRICKIGLARKMGLSKFRSNRKPTYYTILTWKRSKCSFLKHPRAR